MKGKQIILLLAVCLGLAACSPDESNTTIGVEETSAPMVTTVEETSAAPTTEDNRRRIHDRGCGFIS